MTVLLEGPSTFEKGMILFTGAYLIVFLYSAVQGVSAILCAFTENSDIIQRLLPFVQFFRCIEGFLVFPASPWAGLRTRFSALLFASGENSLRRKGIPCGKHAVGMRRRTPPSFPGLGRFPAPAERSRPEPAGSRRRNGVIRCLHQITARFLKSYTVHDKIT